MKTLAAAIILSLFTCPVLAGNKTPVRSFPKPKAYLIVVTLNKYGVKTQETTPARNMASCQRVADAYEGLFVDDDDYNRTIIIARCIPATPEGK